jgi:murein DD-endopeptidase MepM/ murein hydrolase activator NlpD
MISSLNPINSASDLGIYHRDSVIAIDFPLRGIWITPHTPGTKVPSHGTSNFGESYAIDFVMIKDNDPFKKPYGKSFFSYLFRGLALSDFYGWGQTIYSPVDGEVVSIVDSVEERNPVRIFNDIANAIKVTNNYTQHGGSPDSIAGNYVLIKYSNDLYVLLAHMKKGSIIVKPGQKIRTNQPLGQLGHSGNSTMPHLHMQFMNSKDFKIAVGIPFVFRKYEVKRNSKWDVVYNSIPTVNDIVRY